jgi:hypothetical protein
LGGIINQHLTLWEDRYPEFVEEIRKSLYVDDLLSGGATVQEAQTKKSKAKEIFQDARFNLHKWHSNESELELDNDAKDGNDELSYAKQQLGTAYLNLPREIRGETFREIREIRGGTFPESRKNNPVGSTVTIGLHSPVI